MKSNFLVFIFTVFLFLILESISCQRKTHSDYDTIDEAMDDLDQGRVEEAIEKLTPISEHNHSPRVMSLLASAYLFKSHISTQNIVDIFLNFSVNKLNENSESDTAPDSLKSLTLELSTISDFLVKLSSIPLIKEQTQLGALKTGIYYLDSAKPTTSGIALQRGLIRLILSKYQLHKAVQNLFAPDDHRKCALQWEEFKENMLIFADGATELIQDLMLAQPKSMKSWEKSLSGLVKFKDQLAAIEKPKSDMDPLTRDLLVQFLKDNSFTVGCEF